MSFAFGVVRQWFEPVLIEAGPTQIDALFPGAAGLARPMLTGAGGDAPSGDDYGVLHGLYWMLATLAQQAAILLFVDDAHWADDTHGHRHGRPPRPPIA